ncbi:MAG: Uma2 family endonuclease [Pyrinomonadaceae bacterium]|jgi:Uma2 family endonuclease|nr:Uma2 family endonuclease [Pyrinomonadaceae bacterium]
MALAQTISNISVEEYLEGEKVSSVKHEYIDGQVFAMAGVSKNHNRINGNLYSSLLNHLRNRDCEVFIEAVKVRANSITIYYPDLVVTCEKNEEDEYVIHEPCLIVEVLSPATERTDRNEKLINYKQMQSLQEYVIIWQDQVLLEIHRRYGQFWRVERYNELSDEIELVSVNYSINLSEIYQGVNFPQPL